jgi:hypothetical protein
VWFNATLAASAAASCLVYVDRAADTVFLLNDGGTIWNSGVVGTGGTLANGQCSIALDTSSLSASGNTLTVTLGVTFTPSFAGAKNVYMYATNGSIASGWQDAGDWNVPGASDSVTADSSTPSEGSGATQNFALQYSSNLGATNLTTTWVWFHETLATTAAASCLVYVDRAANTVFLLNDAGTVWLSGVLGGGGTLENSQCAVALAGSGASANGNALTVTLSMTFKSVFAGAKNIFMYATNGVAASGWQDRGNWTVPEGPT